MSDIKFVEYKDIHYEIFSVNNLDCLNLSGVGIEDITNVKNLDKLKNLKTLILDSNRITKITGLENLENLKSLSLIGNGISKIEGLSNLKKLESLKTEEEHLFNKWRSYLEQVEKKMSFVDKIVDEAGEVNE